MSRFEEGRATLRVAEGVDKTTARKFPLLSVLCSLVLPLVPLAIVTGSCFSMFFCRSKEPKPPSHERYSRHCFCSGVAPGWGATSFSRQWLAARLLTLLIWGRRNSPVAQTSCALVQNVAKPRSIPYGDGLFLKMFGGWKAKLYNCPSLRMGAGVCVL